MKIGLTKPTRVPRAGKIAAGSMALVLLVACSGCFSKEDPGPLKIQDSTIASAEQPVSERAEPTAQRVPYPVGGQGDPSQNWGDLYLPGGVHKRGTVPMVVLVHGGAWHHSIGASSFDDYARAISARGYAVYNIEYRRVGSGGGWPTTFTDVAAAFDHVKQLMAEHPELSGRAVAVGHSAGAQLATWASTRGDSQLVPGLSAPKFRPSRIVALSGPMDMTFEATTDDHDLFHVMGGKPSQVPTNYSAVDPIQNRDPQIPVTAVHGTADPTVAWQNSQRYVQTLQARGGQADLKLLYGETHGSFLTYGSTHFNEVIDLITNGK